MQGLVSMLNDLTVEEFLTLTNYTDYTDAIYEHARTEYYVEDGVIKGTFK